MLAKQGLSVYCLQKGTVTIAENAWNVMEWYTKQWRYLSYLSSYITVSTYRSIHAVGTHAPAAYTGVAANTTTIPCTIVHSAHSMQLSFLAIFHKCHLSSSTWS